MHDEGYIDDRADQPRPVRGGEAGPRRCRRQRPLRRRLGDGAAPVLSSARSTRTSSSRPPSTSAPRRSPPGALTATLEAEGAASAASSQGAIVAMSPDGAVRAMVGGRDYGSSPFNRAVDAMRQPGSSFKPFVFLAALEAGNYPESVRIDQPVTIRGWSRRTIRRKYLGPVTLQTGAGAVAQHHLGPARRRGRPVDGRAPRGASASGRRCRRRRRLRSAPRR